MSRWGADVVGLNCSVGPATILDALERMAEATDRPLSAQPNAGLPRAVGDRMIYMASPEYMAQYARRLIEAGARFVGGCCGTTPDHVRALAATVSSMQPRPVSVSVSEPAPEPEPRARQTPLATRSAFGARLDGGVPTTSVELVPPRGWDASGLIESARALRDAGVNAVTIPDSPLAQGRMGAMAAALIVQREAGVETVVHYACRNRNMVGMVSDLLGAAAAGLRNVLLVTGDLPREGPYAQATPVFDIDSIGLTNVVHQLNRGLDPGGTSIGEPTRFVIGVALNQGSRDADRELDRFRYKVEAGADFAITQPVFDPDELARMLEALGPRRIPVLASFWPLASLRDAEFLANEVPGVRVPEAVVERMRRAQSKGDDHARAEGLEIARESLAEVRGIVAGYHVASGGGIEPALTLLRAEGALPT